VTVTVTVTVTVMMMMMVMVMMMIFRRILLVDDTPSVKTEVGRREGSRW